MSQPYFDANGTDGAHPDAVHRVYPDGTRIPSTDAAAIFQKDAESQQSDQAAETLRPHLIALRSLTARDAAYAIVARSYAIASNEPPYVIDAIMDRASATAYITSTPWWSALTAPQRQMKSLDLEAAAIRTQAAIAMHR